jgi:hypothetical protein
MPRGWVLVLCVALVVWRPLDFAVELLRTLPSLGMRGVVGVVELVAHAAVATLALVAARALSTGIPVAPKLAAAALITSAGATVQSLYWSVLPHQTVPGDELPIAVLAVLHAGAWLLYLARSRRVRAMTS